MDNLKFAVVGDLVPGGSLIEKNIDPLKEIDSTFSDCNFIWANLECSIPFENTPINNRSSKVPGDYSTLLSVIKSRKFIFSMANNHAMDYDLKNLLKTKELLSKNNIELFGIGSNQEEARKPHLFEFNGVKIGLAAYSSDDKWVGGHLKERPGEYISILNEKTIKEVKEYSKLVDHLFVALHFGKEFTNYPIPGDIEIARLLIDNGASAVFGHHPHVFQGYEIYKGKPVFYSLGNFLFPSFNKPQKLRWTLKERTGLVVKIKIINQESFNWEIIPTAYETGSGMVKKLAGRKSRKVFLKLNRISDPLALSKAEYKKIFEVHFKFVLTKIIVRGITRNIFNPQQKHFIMFFKLVKQFLLEYPAKKST
jgi:hypothetical protein